jgi:hypothetical protein
MIGLPFLKACLLRPESQVLDPHRRRQRTWRTSSFFFGKNAKPMPTKKRGKYPARSLKSK